MATGTERVVLNYISTSDKGITNEIQIAVPWGVIAGKTYGNSKNPPVLCLHGWLDNCNSFDNLIPYLPESKFYIFIDFPGHGRSSPIPIGFFYSVMFAISVIDRVVHCHSPMKWIMALSRDPMTGFLMIFSGNTSVLFLIAWYAATFPEKVDKLILLDSFGVYRVQQNDDILFYLRSPVESYRQLEIKHVEPKHSYSYAVARSKLMKANRAMDEKVVDIILERGAVKLPNGNFEYTRDVRQMPKETNAVNESVAKKLNANIQAETLQILSSAWRPYHVHPSNHEIADELTWNGFKACEHHEVVRPGGNHYVHLCEPEKVVDHIRRFLNRPTRPGLSEEKTKVNSNL